MKRIDLLRDVFIWAYERSTARYTAVRQSLGEPDPFRLRHRVDLRELVGHVVGDRLDRKTAAAHISSLVAEKIDPAERERFHEMAERELLSLHEGEFCSLPHQAVGVRGMAESVGAAPRQDMTTVQYVGVWRLRGANALAASTPSPEVAALTDPKLTAHLSAEPEPYFLHIDRAAALGTQLLKGIFTPDGKGTFEEYLAAEIAGVRLSGRNFHDDDSPWFYDHQDGRLGLWMAGLLFLGTFDGFESEGTSHRKNSPWTPRLTAPTSVGSSAVREIRRWPSSIASRPHLRCQFHSSL